VGRCRSEGKSRTHRYGPDPGLSETAIDEWKESSGVRDGAVFRSINKAEWGNGTTPKVLWEVVRKAAARAVSRSLLRMPLVRLRPSVPSREASWIRFNSCSGMPRSDLPLIG
jgi:hypothetical protein